MIVREKLPLVASITMSCASTPTDTKTTGTVSGFEQPQSAAQDVKSVQKNQNRLAKLGAFLDARRGTWHDFNVPYDDGIELERLVVANRCTRILEIGTSTGHSALWLAKGALQTGGKVITIEIDERRHRQAVRTFEDAELGELIDARLGDAMRIVPTLSGPFDFVFSDATWSTQPADGYVRFFDAADPILVLGGLFTMHNVTDGYGDDGRFFRHLDALGTYETRIIRASNAGISVSRKKGKR